MKGVKHYKKNGVEHKGSTHKMPDGSLHTNKTHSKTSVKLFHLKELSAKARSKLGKKK
tara:strand:- start:1992 stop:2165 length:174 start_codon:yes stop_codon:yes gene_type:complete